MALVSVVTSYTNDYAIFVRDDNIKMHCIVKVYHTWVLISLYVYKCVEMGGGDGNVYLKK